MKLILLQNIKNIGKAGDIKDVSDGYARNFLLPKKLAEAATTSTIAKAQAANVRKSLQEKEELEKIQTLADKISGKKIILKAKAEHGKLFGSISTGRIIDELKKNGLDISEKSIQTTKPIKELGEHQVQADLGHNLKVSFTVSVEEEK